MAELYDIYNIRGNKTGEVNTSSAVFQVEEVSDLRWVSLNKLEHMVKDKSFFKYQELPYVINFINNCKSIREV